MTTIIRAGIPAEAALLAALDRAADAHPWSTGQYRAALEGGGGRHVLVLETGARVVGCVVRALAAGEGSIYRIVTSREHRRQGVGRRLLDAALERMCAAGASRCTLELRVSNLPARSLYESTGFSLDGRRKGYYTHPAQGGAREDALLMSLSLED